jgi:hypothetical protein
VLGVAACQLDQPERAARLLGAAATLRVTFSMSRSPIDDPVFHAGVARGRDLLGFGWDAAFEAGGALRLDEAIATATADDGDR